MTDRAAIARAAASELRQFAGQADRSPVTVGFDGFVDSIIAVVDKRHGIDDYQPIDTIERFGHRVIDAAGKSCNFELVVKLQKLGGNGPIMANALRSVGLPTTSIGALGYPEPDPVFADFASHTTCHCLCVPGYTDALEFDDGKLMLGKSDSMSQITPARIDDVVGRELFARTLESSRLLAMVNWTMIVGMTDIFRTLADEVLGSFAARPLIFVDLADPQKRTTADIQTALALLGQMQKHTEVALGLNLKESVQVAQALDIDPTDNPADIIEELSLAIRESLAIHAVVVHPRLDAAAAVKNGDAVSSARMTGAFTKTPKLSTGAGDNFNAGFCLGMLADLPVDQALCVGNAVSGFYVRNARSATMDELAEFLDVLPEPEVD